MNTKKFNVFGIRQANFNSNGKFYTADVLCLEGEKGVYYEIWFYKDEILRDNQIAKACVSISKKVPALRDVKYFPSYKVLIELPCNNMGMPFIYSKENKDSAYIEDENKTFVLRYNRIRQDAPMKEGCFEWNEELFIEI